MLALIMNSAHEKAYEKTKKDLLKQNADFTVITDKNPEKWSGALTYCIRNHERFPYFFTLLAGDRLEDTFTARLLEEASTLPDSAAGMDIGLPTKQSSKGQRENNTIERRAIMWKTSVLAESFPDGFPGFAWQPFREQLFTDLYHHISSRYLWHPLPQNLIKAGQLPIKAWYQQQSLHRWVEPIWKTGPVPLPFSTTSNSTSCTRKEPFITIALCVYNGELYLPWAIRSVLAQTMTSWELIIVDDNSTDGTRQAISPYLTDSRIRSIRLESNHGKARCLNEALRTAKGKWFIELDADDWFSCDALELITNRLAEKAAPVFLYGYYAEWKEKAPGELHIQQIRKTDFPITKQNLLAKGIPLAPRVYLTAMLKNLGGWQLNDPFGGRLYEDLHMILRITNRYQSSLLPAVLYHRRLRGSSITKTNQKQYQNWIKWVNDISF